jgi:hypothetical protein
MGAGSSSVKKSEMDENELDNQENELDEEQIQVKPSKKKASKKYNEDNENNTDNENNENNTVTIGEEQTYTKSQSHKFPKKELSEKQLIQVENIKSNINNKIKNCQKNLDNIGDDEDYDKVRDELNGILEELEDLLTKDKKEIITINHSAINCDNTYKKFKNQLVQVENIKSNINNKIVNCKKNLKNVEDSNIRRELQAMIKTLEDLNEQSSKDILRTSHSKYNCDPIYNKYKSQTSSKKGSKSSTKKGSNPSPKKGSNSSSKKGSNSSPKKGSNSSSKKGSNSSSKKGSRSKKMKEKYLKYKMKYLHLKNLVENGKL